MNSKQLGILIILVVVLGGAGLWIYKGQSDTSGSGDPTLGKKFLAQLAINDVNAIAVKQGSNTLTLARKEGAWRVAERGDYLANYNEISDLLLKLRDLKVIETEKVGTADLARLSLAPGAGLQGPTEVEFKDQANKTLQTLLLGKKHTRKAPQQAPSMMGMDDEGRADGRYVATKMGADSVMLVSDALANLEPHPEQWLNKDFFKVDKVRSLSVTYPQSTNSWKITRETEAGEWKLADAKPEETLDASKTASLSSPLSAPSFNDVASGATLESLGLDKGTNILIETFENFSYAVKVGQKSGDNFAMMVAVSAQLPGERAPGKDEKPEDKDRLDKEFKETQKKLQEKLSKEKAYEKWIYEVAAWTLDPVLKTRAELLTEKKPAEPAEGASTNSVPEIATEPK